MAIKEYALKELGIFKNYKITYSNFHVSTDNMNGHDEPKFYPKKGNEYKKDHILMSNIRPYFNKVWYANRSGSKSPGILSFEVANKEIVIPKFLYYYICSNKFNEYWSKTSKGTTMPVGDKNAILNYLFKIPNLQTQQEIINIIEPKEQLFLKYHNVVDISDLDKFKKTWSNLINIIEPFENKKAKLLETRNYFQNLIKNIYFKSQSKKTIKISDVFEIKRNKKIDSKDVIELSSLNSYELFNSHFGNIDDFKTNIFSIKKHDIYISTIRPKLKKFGIAWKDSNILGTICVLSGNIQNISSLLGLLLQEDFIDKCILNSCGTKMPVLNKKWLVQNEFKKLNENEIDLIKKIINYVSNLSEQIFLLEKIINSLILLYII